MRVILTQPVPKLGEVGDLCEVAPGYGRNFLIPQGYAIMATAGALRQVDDLRRTEARRQAAMRSTLEVTAEKIEAARLSFTAKVGETGRLYGSITSADIAEELEARIGEPVDRRKILLDEPIKALGEHEVPLHLMPGLNATIHVLVEADEEVMLDVGLSEEEAAEAMDGAEPIAAADDTALEEDDEAPEDETSDAEEMDEAGSD